MPRGAVAVKCAFLLDFVGYPSFGGKRRSEASWRQSMAYPNDAKMDATQPSCY